MVSSQLSVFGPATSEENAGTTDIYLTKQTRKYVRRSTESELDRSIEHLKETRANLKRIDRNIQKQLRELHAIKRKYRPSVAVVEAEEAIARMREEISQQ